MPEWRRWLLALELSWKSRGNGAVLDKLERLAVLAFECVRRRRLRWRRELSCEDVAVPRDPPRDEYESAALPEVGADDSDARSDALSEAETSAYSSSSDVSLGIPGSTKRPNGRRTPPRATTAPAVHARSASALSPDL